MQEKLVAKIAEISETINITEATKVDDLNMWDSLAIISLMIYAKNDLGIKFNDIEKLEEVQTVGDICSLLLNGIVS